MDQVEITIMILTYRRPYLLKRAILSALNQAYPHLRVVVFDNASGDETEEIVRSLMMQEERLHYHQHPINIGMIANYQSALASVQTPFFSLLSDDDVLLPCFCKTALQGFEEHPESIFSAGSTIIMTEQGKVVRVPLDLWKRDGYFIPPEGLLEMMTRYPVPTTILFRREVIDKVAIDPTNVLGWDVDYLIQIAMQFPFYISKKPCGIFLQHDKSYSNSQEMVNWVATHDKLMERIQSSSQLPQEVAAQAFSCIQKDTKGVSMAFFFIYLRNRKLKEAKLALKLLQERYGNHWKITILTSAVRLCTMVPFAYHLLSLALVIKRFLRKKTAGYEQYAKWLEI